MGRYILVDKAAGEEVEADADMVERVTGVELSHIDWLIEDDEKFENGDWEVCFSPIFGDRIIGTEDLFTKCNWTIGR